MERPNCECGKPVEISSSRGNTYFRKLCSSCRRKSSDWAPKREAARKVKWGTTRRYKMTTEQFNAKLASQNGVCAICAQPAAEGKRLVVDHNHACCAGDKNILCGKCNRDLLCHQCNILVGYLETRKYDLATLEAAVSYIKDHETKP